MSKERTKELLKELKLIKAEVKKSKIYDYDDLIVAIEQKLRGI
jgi:hypothetical protein